MEADQVPAKGSRNEQEVSEPEIEALFGNGHTAAENKNAEDREENQAPPAKRQRREHAPLECAYKGERLREIREELSIATDFELSRFIYCLVQTRGWGNYFLDGKKFIHPEMVHFAYSCPITEEKDELMAGLYIVKFDKATINEELGLELDGDLLDEAMLLNLEEKDLVDALKELCVQEAA